MSQDPTENIRRALVAENAAAVESNDPSAERARLEKIHGVGNVFDTDEVRKQFVIHGFMAPFVSCNRISDNAKGFLEFQHSPRFYFDFQPK